MSEVTRSLPLYTHHCSSLPRGYALCHGNRKIRCRWGISVSLFHRCVLFMSVNLHCDVHGNTHYNLESGLYWLIDDGFIGRLMIDDSHTLYGAVIHWTRPRSLSLCSDATLYTHCGGRMDRRFWPFHVYSHLLSLVRIIHYIKLVWHLVTCVCVQC